MPVQWPDDVYTPDTPDQAQPGEVPKNLVPGGLGQLTGFGRQAQIIGRGVQGGIGSVVGIPGSVLGVEHELFPNIAPPPSRYRLPTLTEATSLPATPGLIETPGERVEEAAVRGAIGAAPVSLATGGALGLPYAAGVATETGLAAGSGALSQYFGERDPGTGFMVGLLPGMATGFAGRFALPRPGPVQTIANDLGAPITPFRVAGTELQNALRRDVLDPTTPPGRYPPKTLGLVFGNDPQETQKFLSGNPSVHDPQAATHPDPANIVDPTNAINSLLSDARDDPSSLRILGNNLRPQVNQLATSLAREAAANNLRAGQYNRLDPDAQEALFTDPSHRQLMQNIYVAPRGGLGGFVRRAEAGAVSSIAGMDAVDFLSRHVLEPLNMHALGDKAALTVLGIGAGAAGFRAGRAITRSFPGGVVLPAVGGVGGAAGAESPPSDVTGTPLTSTGPAAPIAQ